MSARAGGEPFAIRIGPETTAAVRIGSTTLGFDDERACSFGLRGPSAESLGARRSGRCVRMRCGLLCGGIAVGHDVVGQPVRAADRQDAGDAGHVLPAPPVAQEVERDLPVRGGDLA